VSFIEDGARVGELQPPCREPGDGLTGGISEAVREFISTFFELLEREQESAGDRRFRALSAQMLKLRALVARGSGRIDHW
jgi:hypothetical protein